MIAKDFLPKDRPFDRLNREIKVGSIIAYGHALGRCAGIRIGKVLAIKHVPERKFYPGDSRWRLTVLGVDDDWHTLTPELCKRKGTLMFPERMVVVDFYTLPATYQTLLEGV